MSKIIQDAIETRKKVIIDRLIYSGFQLREENRQLSDLTLTELEEYNFLATERQKADRRRRRKERFPAS